MASSLRTARSELVKIPLAKFTARRTALAASLAATGKGDEAAALRRLHKPSPPLWALNRLALDDPQAISRLLGQAEELRAAERGAPTPAGARRAVSLGRAFRDSVQALARRAAASLVENGAPATAATRRRIHASLLGLATAGRDEVRALSRGELDHELRPPDVSDVLALLPRAAPARHRQPTAREVARGRARARTAAPEARANEGGRRQAESAVVGRRSRTAARAASEAAADAERRAEAARRQARSALEEADRAAKRARMAQRHAAEEEKRARAARRLAARGRPRPR